MASATFRGLGEGGGEAGGVGQMVLGFEGGQPGQILRNVDQLDGKLGELWAERSGGSGLFVMPKGKDWSASEAVLQVPPPSGALFQEKLRLPTGR